MKEDFAIIIGIDDYTPPEELGLKTLCGAVNDANSFEEWVTSETGGNLPDENVKKIISAPSPLKPLQDEIDTAFLEIEDSIRENGGSARRLYFYFAGHGLGTLDSTRDTALCLANWSERRRKSALSSEHYKDQIKQYGYFEEIFFVADCCRNTKINVKPLTPTFSCPIPGEASGKTKMFEAYATQYQDQSYEIESDNAEKRGAFTTVFIEALEGAAGRNGAIGADDLRDYLVIETPKLAQQRGYKQTPEVFHSFIENATVIHATAALTKVNIIFSSEDNNVVELLDGGLNPVSTFEAAESKNYSIELAAGLYLLKDSIAEKNKHFQVSTSKNDINVNF